MNVFKAKELFTETKTMVSNLVGQLFILPCENGWLPCVAHLSMQQVKMAKNNIKQYPQA